MDSCKQVIPLCHRDSFNELMPVIRKDPVGAFFCKPFKILSSGKESPAQDHAKYTFRKYLGI